MLGSLKPSEGSPELFPVLGAVVVMEGESREQEGCPGPGAEVCGELPELDTGR